MIYAGIIRALDKSLALPDTAQVFDSFYKAVHESAMLSKGDRHVLCEAIGSILNKTTDEAFIDHVLQVSSFHSFLPPAT